MEDGPNPPRGSSRTGAYTVATLSTYLGALLALTGVQLIAPAFPQLQVTYGLSDAAAGLITSTFLLPSIGSALAAGYLADRFGRRLIYTAALLVYGLAAPLQLLVTSAEPFFAIRIVQGTAFGAILPLTMIILGDIVRGREQLRAQATRNLAMGFGDSLFPVLGGVLVALGDWRYALALQVLTIPLALLAWRTLPTASEQQAERAGKEHAVGREVILSGPSIALQLSGFLRFLFKFGLNAYLPLLLDRNGVPVGMIGIALGSASILTIAVNLAATRFGQLRAPGLLNLMSLVGIGVAYLVLALTDSLPLHLVALTLYGLFDALLGLVQNTYLVTRFDASERSIVTGWVGTSRNLGKAMAPVIMGAIIAASDLRTTFLIIGAIALAVAPTSRSFRAEPPTLNSSGRTRSASRRDPDRLRRTVACQVLEDAEESGFDRSAGPAAQAIIVPREVRRQAEDAVPRTGAARGVDLYVDHFAGRYLSGVLAHRRTSSVISRSKRTGNVDHREPRSVARSSAAGWSGSGAMPCRARVRT